MADRLTKAQRSANMAKIRSGGTKPEMVVRRLVHRLGFRYRLHSSALPGKPDMVFPARKKVVFVHGCFWHKHRCPEGRRVPKSRLDYWGPKILGNARRDAITRRRLRRLGWDVLTVWECETVPAKLDRLAAKLSAFLSSPVR